MKSSQESGAPRRLLPWFFLWLLLAITFAVLIGRINWTRYYALYRHGVRTDATVLAKEPHQSVRYRFTANGRSYEGISTPGSGNPPYAGIAPGQSIAVYYLATDPTQNCAGSPSTRLRSETESIILVVAFAPIFLVFTLQWWLKRMRIMKVERLHDS